jgi:hypothetical protein
MTELSQRKDALCAILLCAMITSAAAQKFTVLANLPEASDPLAPLVQGRDGSFYGTTTTAPDGGSIFSVTQEGDVTQLYAFTSIYDGLGMQPRFARSEYASRRLIAKMLSCCCD